MIISGVVYDGIKKCEKRLKNVAEKFGSKEKSRTFATPIKNGVLARGFDKFIEKTDLLYKKQVPRKYNLSRSVNFFGNYKCQDKLRNINYYTMKSLILAQDER